MQGPIKRFKISGLYGYKNVEIVFPGQVLILIAGNGSGKTTILNALHAFLRGRFNRLRSLEFASIECEFHSTGELVTLNKSQITALEPGTSELLSTMARAGGISEDQIYDFVASVYDPGKGIRPFIANSVVRTIFDASPWGFDDIEQKLNELHALIGSGIPEDVQLIRDQVARAIDGIEIVYLPTYRRIENPMLSPASTRRRHRLVRTRNLPQHGTTLQEQDQINYALNDVEERLAELSDEAERISNWEYRSASATIIDEALEGQPASGGTAPEELPLPDIDSLVRFLSRVSRADATALFEVPSRESEESSKRRVEAIKDLYATGRINHGDLGLLRYFLSRLGPVIEKTKVTEIMLQKFVEACNGYLQSSSDEKKFVYEPNSMRVTVVNNFTNKVVPMNQLSSGETQVISLFARLYLYPRRNLVLIDEPELSLSLDWQRKIIPDMMRSESVEQLLAITHSPFIFENEYDPFAGTMAVSREKKDQP